MLEKLEIISYDWEQGATTKLLYFSLLVSSVGFALMIFFYLFICGFYSIWCNPFSFGYDLDKLLVNFKCFWILLVSSVIWIYAYYYIFIYKRVIHYTCIQVFWYLPYPRIVLVPGKTSVPVFHSNLQVCGLLLTC